MSNEKREYLKRFNQSPRAKSLAGEHYTATYSSCYWGSKGAIAIAKLLADELEEVGRNQEAKMLLLSTYYGAAGSSLALWKKQKWNLLYLFRTFKDSISARWLGEEIISVYVPPAFRWKEDSRAWDALLATLTESELEVLMSPYWAIALKVARFGTLFWRDKFTACLIGRRILASGKKEDTMSYALVAGKMYQLSKDGAERSKLKFVVMKATENKFFAAKDRARLHILLGEHERAAELGKQEGLADVVLKAGA